MTQNIKHILRYGTNAEQKYIENLHYTFDTLAINGNMLAYTPGALAKFLMTHCLDLDRKGCFFIDPITHAFQHSIDKIKTYNKKNKKFVIKKSISNLINCYGEPIKSKIASNKIIIPNDFSNYNIKENFCTNVINFQLNTIKEQLNKKGFLEYFCGEKDLLDKLEPCFVIPPYFYITESTYNDWLPLNIEFINIAKKLYKNKNIFGQLVISKEVLTSKSFREDVSEKYSSCEIKDLLIWIDDFNEHEASINLLEGYIDLIKCLNKNNINVYNLYGGFFSIMLTKSKEELGFQLKGVGHGLEYGEHRAVVPVGGGIPTSKYYYYPLHQRLDYKLSSELLETLGYFEDKVQGAEKYYKDICKCNECKEVIQHDIENFSKFENTEFYNVTIKGVKQRRPYASQKTKEICIMHYQFCKQKEFKNVSEKSINYILKYLKTMHELYKSLGVLSLEQLSYINNWRKALENE
mgnify:CR=1 FL=1